MYVYISQATFHDTRPQGPQLLHISSKMSTETRDESPPLSAGFRFNLSQIFPEMEVESSLGTEETQAKPWPIYTKERINSSQISVDERIESFSLPLHLQKQYSNISPEVWMETFTCIPSLHSAILALRFSMPEAYRSQFPASVGIVTEKGILMSWIELFRSIPNPLPITNETDRHRKDHGHFIHNIRRLRLFSDNIRRAEDGILQFEFEGAEAEAEDGNVVRVPLEDADAPPPSKEEYIRFCVDCAEYALQEMAGLLPKIYHTTQKIEERVAYRKHQRRVAEEAAEPDQRDYRDDLHPSILSLEYSVPESYQSHFTQEQNTRGIMEHWIHFIGYTPEPRTQGCWTNYKRYEDCIRSQKNLLLEISDDVRKYEDARYWLYGDDDMIPPPPESRRQELIQKCLEKTKEVLSIIVHIFPQLHEALLQCHRQYEIEQNQPLVSRNRVSYTSHAQSEHEIRRRQDLVRQRLSREAERRAERENESPYMVAQRLGRAYREWHAGRAPNPSLAMAYPQLFRRTRRRPRDGLLPRSDLDGLPGIMRRSDLELLPEMAQRSNGETQEYDVQALRPDPGTLSSRTRVARVEVERLEAEVEVRRPNVETLRSTVETMRAQLERQRAAIRQLRELTG